MGRKNWIVRECEWCGGEFLVEHRRKRKARFCSRSCSSSFNFSHYWDGPNNGNWKGGKTTHTKGYIMIRDIAHPRSNPNGYVMEHIVVAEKKIGRRLAPHEVVHHIDLDKTNNKPDNLVVMDSGEHTAMHCIM